MSSLILHLIQLCAMIAMSCAFLEKCCDFGRGLSDKNCNNISIPPSSVQPNQMKLCQSSARLCCEEKANVDNCMKGVIQAKKFRKCLENTTSCARCCEICILGQSTGVERKPCVTTLTVNNQYQNIFQECCEFAKYFENKNDTNESDYNDYDYPSQTKDFCELFPGQLCQQICTPTPNSYYCSCREGFILMEDQKTCQLERDKPKQKPSGKTLQPNPERPVPLKKPVDGTQKTPCKDGNPCEHECLDAPRGQVCSCRPGYELKADRMHCQDINECLDNIHVCDPELEMCVNEESGYRCDRLVLTKPLYETTTTPDIIKTTVTAAETVINCPKGFITVLDRCEDINECTSDNVTATCGSNTECVNTLGSFICRCARGFQQEKTTNHCVDINECQMNTHECDPQHRCDNTIGSYHCHRVLSCGTGYTLNANSGQCEDDDECLLQTHTCQVLGPDFQCRNTQGSFRCERRTSNCPSGYTLTTSGQCKDIDECRLRTHNCPPYTHSCVNRPGTFECRSFRTCSQGYEATTNGCVDIDECSRNTHSCGPNTECHNHNGGFTCACKIGYHPVSNTECQDIDECQRHGCPPTADCKNTLGSFECSCHIGFQQVNRNRCQDVDECISQPGICEQHCENTYGSYRCSCNNGFRIHSDNRSCQDIDECEIYKEQRLCHGYCVNQPGSFTCSCPPGYFLAGDGRTCQDVDECMKNPCRGPHEVCLNTRGSFACNSIECPEGYIQDHEQRNRCRRICRDNSQKCLDTPVTLSYNYITFVSNLPIPTIGYLDLFTMRGPLSAGSDTDFKLELIASTSKNHPNVTLATRHDFHLRNPGWSQAVVSLIHPVYGPQVIELKLSANMYHNGIFVGIGVAKLFIHVSEYEF